VATEPDQTDGHESSMVESDSNQISREDTMVEHSVVINDDDSPSQIDADYMHALDSVKFDLIAARIGPAYKSGEFDMEQSSDKQNKVNAHFGPEEEKLIEISLMQIRDRIRNGQPLSH